jgi:hypothetical protein
MLLCCAVLCRFVLLHPVDNVGLKYSDAALRINATDPAQGTAWHFAHFYAASCNVTYVGAKKPWVSCPRSRQAFTCTTPQQKLAGTLSTNTTSYYAQRLDKQGFAAVVTMGGVVVSKVVYTWQETSSGLQITQDLVFGIDEPWAAPLNAQGLQDLVGKATNGDAQLGLAALVLHEIEVVGWYPLWLPAVHRAVTGSGTAVASSREASPLN